MHINDTSTGYINTFLEDMSQDGIQSLEALICLLVTYRM